MSKTIAAVVLALGVGLYAKRTIDREYIAISNDVYLQFWVMGLDMSKITAGPITAASITVVDLKELR